MIRVRHLVRTLDVGGLEMLVLELARHTDSKRFQVSVVCLGEPGAAAERFEASGISIHALRTSGPAAGLFALARHLRQERPDILHTHNASPHIIGSLAASIVRVPVVIQTRHGQHHAQAPRSVLLSRLASRLSNVIVAVSRDAAAVAHGVGGIPEGKLVVIHNGVDLSRFSPNGSRPTGAAARGICVARLDALKDHSTLLEAIRRVVEQRKDFTMTLVGDGPERGRIEELCRSLGLDSHVTLAGQRQDVRPFLAESGLFALASVSEGLALTVLEAMAAALPVVATDVGGNREVVVDGQTGVLVPAASPEAMSDGILRLLADPAMAEEMGRQGRRRVEEHFDLRSTVAAYEHLYTRLLERRPMPAAASPLG